MCRHDRKTTQPGSRPERRQCALRPVRGPIALREQSRHAAGFPIAGSERRLAGPATLAAAHTAAGSLRSAGEALRDRRLRAVTHGRARICSAAGGHRCPACPGAASGRSGSVRPVPMAGSGSRSPRGRQARGRGRRRGADELVGAFELTAGEFRAAVRLAQRDAGGVAGGAAGPGAQRGQPGDQGGRGVPGEAGPQVLGAGQDQGPGLAVGLGAVAASIDSQNRCGSRSPRPAGTHATRSDSLAAPAWPIQDRSSTVFPLPGPGHVTTDMGRLDMTKHNRDLVKRGAAASTSGSGQVTGPAGGDPRAERRRGSGLWRGPGLPHRRPGAGREAQRLASGGLHSGGLR